jgi:hypothetical protein
VALEVPEATIGSRCVHFPPRRRDLKRKLGISERLTLAGVNRSTAQVNWFTIRRKFKLSLKTFVNIKIGCLRDLSGRFRRFDPLRRIVLLLLTPMISIKTNARLTVRRAFELKRRQNVKPEI